MSRKLFLIFLLFSGYCSKNFQSIPRNGGFDNLIISSLIEGNKDRFWEILDESIISTTGFRDDIFKKGKKEEFENTQIVNILFDKNYDQEFNGERLYSFRNVFQSKEGRTETYELKDRHKFVVSKIYKRVEYSIYYRCKTECKIENISRDYDSSE